ncbi:protein TolA [Microbulbifer flavimaris]|uniref:Protein TolA n=1 Tax=Microbulbifer flavimaris TaxID=1781068 RepID=A0ABX4HZI5_9GAMM|nr:MULTISPECIES: cell envelope integrity protein TolA [Microbulbifer]KUJ83407.1 protein TolA [Microbulbifer sp. ZGT114]PCO05562.1 protein TolA [Microbulbifer flavimaris]
MNNASSYALPVIISVALHALLIAVLTFGWEATQEPPRKMMPNFVQAKLVTMDAAVKKKAAPPKVDLIKQRQQQEQQRQREAKAERERRAALERKKKQEAEKRRKAEAERKRKAAEEKARKEKERKEQERKEQMERERQSAFEEALEEEEELLDARESTQAVMSVAQAIQQRIESVWSQPPSARNGMVTEVSISFVPTGRVVASNITKSSGNAALDRSVLNAVRKVEVFPEVAELAREEPTTFEREVRNTQLIFRVEGLRQ